MKQLLFALTVLACCSHASAQDAQAGDRARIADERRTVQERHAAEEKACYSRFAVNDCLDDARARRREVLAELRRQEVALNDRERQSKGAARLRALEEKAPPDPAQERERAAAVQAGRESAAEKKAARAAARTFAGATTADAPARKAPARVAKPLKTPRQASAARAGNGGRGDDGDSVRRRQQRLEAADARRQGIENKLASRHKPPAAPLPVPP